MYTVTLVLLGLYVYTVTLVYVLGLVHVYTVNLVLLGLYVYTVTCAACAARPLCVYSNPCAASIVCIQ